MTFPSNVGNLSVQPLYSVNNLSDLSSPQIAMANVGAWSAGVYVPTVTGFTYTIPNNQTTSVFTPSGALTGCTVLLPSGALSGLPFVIMSTAAIATVVVSGQNGQTSGGTAISAFAQNTGYSFTFVNGVWYRTQ